MSSERSDYQVHLIGLGCPKNTVDAERMLGLLRASGYTLTSDPARADVIIVNTCAFIAPAREESIDTVMAAHGLRSSGRCRAVIVSGCLATRYEDQLREELREADEIVPVEQEADIVRRVDRALGLGGDAPVTAARPVALTPGHWAYLRISDGCDHHCAFCTIPAIRGRHRSEPMEVLLERAAERAQAGARELVLVAQDSLRYGVDLYGRPRLVPLLEQLARVEGIEWLRLMYTHPAFWNDELLDFYASCPAMCRYVDLPLQHISDAVLRRMNRPSTQDHIRRLLERLRRRLPGVALRSTFIVGFPGETETQFQELLDFIQDARFDHVSAFLYSPEEGTPALSLDGEVEESVKEERYARLTEAQESVSAQINADLVGTQHRVLVDEVDPSRDVAYARMERDAPEIDGVVIIDSGTAPAGAFVQVEITDGYAYERRARVVDRPATPEGP